MRHYLWNNTDLRLGICPNALKKLKKLQIITKILLKNIDFQYIMLMYKITKKIIGIVKEVFYESLGGQ